jgi:adenylyltransferase/sulfurtransferase
VGSIQAMEAMKLIIGIGETLTGRLLLIDGLTMEINTMRLRKNPNCPTCGDL